MQKRKTKLGARILSKEELNAILPNAESVYEQIDMFRDSMPEQNGEKSGEQFEMEQQTNNIGIMGQRGTGKTSVLKTFYHTLKGENVSAGEGAKSKESKDIILPIIIPENMSEGTTLMDAILGRMKSVIENWERKEKGRDEEDCIYSGRDSLEKKYNELVKQYCYIKKDYRDILIQEFTTEQNYVDKSKKVFASDAEFNRMFRAFVGELLQHEKENGKETEKSPMLFLFIDDVDLSTNRCTDIVRTLLVYLSRPGIVTFISGDIKTFEEELTLEFLRQEEALRENVYRETYYISNNPLEKSSLLERKKTLAYDYLKKIIPPAYRRTIRTWTLEERGNYRIGGDEDQSLAELLAEVAKEKLEDSYFIYEENGEAKCMKLAFHMFDETARGLNNVYNVLQEIYAVQEKETDRSNGKDTFLFWRLIETMVDSKRLYAGLKEELLTRVLVLGQGQVEIDFENAYALLYEKKLGEDKREFSAAERFSIFYLIDFAKRLFYKEQPGEKDIAVYNDLKRKIIQEYLSDDTIEDRIAEKRELLAYLVEEKEMQNWGKDSGERILITFLRECDFVFVLHLIQYLGKSEIYYILYEKSGYSDKEIAYKTAYAFYNACRAVSKSEDSLKNYITGLCLDRQMEITLLKLLDKLSLDPIMIYGGRLTDSVSVGNGGMRYQDEHLNKLFPDMGEAFFWNLEDYMAKNDAFEAGSETALWIEYKLQNAVYWIIYEKTLREKKKERVPFDSESKAEEMIRTGLTKAIMTQLEVHGIMNQYEVRALEAINYGSLLEKGGKKQKAEIQVVELIDKQGAWDSDYAKRIVIWYLSGRKNYYIHEMSRGRAIFEATQFVTETYAALKNCYKGLSGNAVIHDLEYRLRKVMFLPTDQAEREQRPFSDGKYYLRLEQALIIQLLLEEFLQFHQRVHYGKKEAKTLLMKVKELPFVIHAFERERVDRELRKREEEFFTKKSYFWRDEAAAKLAKSEKGKAALRNIREIWYDLPKRKNSSMKELIKQFLGETGEKDYKYFWYLVQKEQIERQKSRMKVETEKTNSGKAALTWSAIEPVMPEKDYLFIFHSYLRYLQANDEDTKNAGRSANAIAGLAHHILDSEERADEKIQNEFYRTISEELDLTEKEFEDLF